MLQDPVHNQLYFAMIVTQALNFTLVSRTQSVYQNLGLFGGFSSNYFDPFCLVAA